jgi:hypothetical protein
MYRGTARDVYQQSCYVGWLRHSTGPASPGSPGSCDVIRLLRPAPPLPFGAVRSFLLLAECTIYMSLERRSYKHRGRKTAYPMKPASFGMTTTRCGVEPSRTDLIVYKPLAQIGSMAYESHVTFACITMTQYNPNDFQALLSGLPNLDSLAALPDQQWLGQHDGQPSSSFDPYASLAPQPQPFTMDPRMARLPQLDAQGMIFAPPAGVGAAAQVSAWDGW